VCVYYILCAAPREVSGRRLRRRGKCKLTFDSECVLRELKVSGPCWNVIYIIMGGCCPELFYAPGDEFAFHFAPVSATLANAKVIFAISASGCVQRVNFGRRGRVCRVNFYNMRRALLKFETF
jgi:hypothetical protein